MPDEPENLTIRLLQEMREGLTRLESRMEERFGDIDDRITDLVQRVDGNTLIFNLVAEMVHDHEERISAVEEGRA